ncbi:hypothetical protein [Mesorhizobium sp. M4B.F.Ca.ET.058.02.1.1]|uniref:hypothetical protein n=1 Tax=Mesorhizobium sp. M4B.F.Ca.ET.058.02.1.1 TaxID=2493675 RepID=UPI000F765A75|nr:hypothetical protein [Mesorhizobium sp. M4B.F.Ca.ET.058.02.1.1]AZO48026.1 hypothetical protein EJ073_09495 [Mesorhizobium sp. M4B.F.Ca.ET.058.02.1.1]
MAARYKRKADDTEIVRLNNIGLSLTSIGERLGVHHTTVKYRLDALGIPPADTRRAFMEDIFSALPVSQQEWLMNQLGPGHTVKDFVRSLLIKEFMGRAAPITES